MSAGNWISVIGFSLCFAYLIVLLVFYFVKRHKAKKEIKKCSKKGKSNEDSKVAE